MADSLKMTMDDLEKTFGEIADKRIAAAKAVSDAEAAKTQAEERQKASFRAEQYEILDAVAEHNEKFGRKQSSPLELFGKYVACGIKSANMSEGQRSASKELAYKAAEILYPEDKALLGLMKKDLQVNIPSAGGYTIPQVLSPDVIRALYANSILDKLNATKVPMPNGNFRMARMDTTDTVGWVGELPSANPTAPAFGDVNLNAKKLFALVPVSNSLIRYNAVGIDAWVSQDLARKAAIGLDLAALYGAGTQYTPTGLLTAQSKTPANNIGQMGTSASLFNAGTTLAFGLTTPIDMTALLEQANTPMISPAWIINPIVKGWMKGKAFSTGPFAWGAEMNVNKTLNGFPFVSSASAYYTSASTATGDAFLGDWSEFLWGVAYDISLEISREASFVTSAGTTYSAFQRDETLVRLIAEHDFSVKHPTSFTMGSFTQA